MQIKRLSVLGLLFYLNIAFAQKEEPLLTIEGDPVYAEEFLQLYNKNLDLVKDDAQKEVDNYLELFVNYKLKLKEALSLGLDKDANYKREFENYKKQLVKNYISDNKVTETLVKEAYDRMRYDIKASHILVLDNPEVEDTLIAYNKLLDFRKVLKSEGFAAAKEKYHDGTTILVEDLGYFSAFKMVYDFESMAYKTKVGEVSIPFKTQFGYHVVKIDDKRLSRGTVTAAHIMVSLKQKDSTVDAKERIDMIHKKLQQGEDFDALAKQFSDDKSSARSGGKLRPFKSGQLSSSTFEDAAFALEYQGDVTPPVKTEYGWHIIKLLKKEPIQSYEDIKPTLQARVKRDSRSKLINSAMVKELAQRYRIVKNKATKAYFKPILENAYFSGKFNIPENYIGSDSVITVNDSVYSNNDFLQHLKSKQRDYMRQKTSINKVLDKELNAFYEQSVLNFREENLENENPEFASILKEYKDGLLLFALMEKEIWNKASKDTLGLQAFYNAHTSNYQWKDRITASIASTSSEALARKIKGEFEKGKSKNEIEEVLNTEKEQNTIFTTGTFEKNDQKLPEGLQFKLGVSDVYEHNGGFHVFNISEVLPSSGKKLEEVRGLVINDYQNKIEKDWLEGLRKKFKVEVNQKVLSKLKSKISK